MWQVSGQAFRVVRVELDIDNRAVHGVANLQATPYHAAGQVVDVVVVRWIRQEIDGLPGVSDVRVDDPAVRAETLDSPWIWRRFSCALLWIPNT